MMIIVLAAITASDVIPETGKKSNDFPGWTKKISYLREIGLFWRSIWISLNILCVVHVSNTMM